MNFEVDYNVSGFVYIDQQIRDVLRVVDTVTPVLSLMRDYYNAGEQLKESEIEIERANGEIQAYSNVLASFELTEEIKLSIEAEIKKVREYGEKCASLQPELNERLKDLQEAIYEYGKYIHSFDWLHLNLLIEVLSRLPEENKAKLVATILLFTNNSIKEEERNVILSFLCGENEFVTDTAIKYALMSLQNDEDAFMKYISERDFE